MCHDHTPWVSSSLLASLLLACTSGGGGGLPADVQGDASDTAAPVDAADATQNTIAATDVVTPTDTTVPPSWEDDDALLAWLLAIVAGCPPTSLSTAPGDWETSLLTEGGCTVRHPADWLTKASTGLFTTTRDATEQVGWLVVASAVEGVEWDVDSLSSYLIDQLRADYPDIAVIGAWTDPLVDPWGVTTWMKTQVVKLTHSGARSLGVFKLVHTACSPILGLCPLTATGSWAPLPQLPTWACTLAQIEATLRCPSSGGESCDDDTCDQACRDTGNDGGSCVGDHCACY